jgi:hypothetical protein
VHIQASAPFIFLEKRFLLFVILRSSFNWIQAADAF